MSDTNILHTDSIFKGDALQLTFFCLYGKRDHHRTDLDIDNHRGRKDGLKTGELDAANKLSKAHWCKTTLQTLDATRTKRINRYSITVSIRETVEIY